MLKLALATSAQLPELNEDDRLLLAELRARGAEAGPAVWDDPQVGWEAFDRVVIRSCWDYHRRLPEFLGWLNRLERLETPLWNPAPLVRANAHKSYLGELGAAGFAVVPTAAVARGSGASLAGLLHERGWSRLDTASLGVRARRRRGGRGAADADGAGADRAVPLSFVRSRGGLPVRGCRLLGAALRRRGQAPGWPRTRLSSFSTSVG